MRAILTWHSIDDSGSPISVSEQMFRKHARWLVSGRVRVVSLEELQRTPDDVDAVALTFDDGFANFATLAAPLLREYALPSTLFVVTAAVGRDNRWGGGGKRSGRGMPVLPLADWDTLNNLVAGGGVTLEAHTRTHPDLTLCAPGQMEEELEGAAAELERYTGRRPEGIAYPYGSVNDAVVAAARGTYRCGCTTRYAVLGGQPDPICLPRLDMWYIKNVSYLEGWGGPGFQRRLRWREALRNVRQVVERRLGQ